MGITFVGEMRENLSGGHTVYDNDGDVVLEGRLSPLHRTQSHNRF
jgi:hypothetical protein